MASRGKKNANGEGSKARRRKDGRFETRATLDTPTGRRRVSFYGKTAEEATEKKIEAIANQNKGILFSDPKKLTLAEYLTRWLSDTVRYRVSEGTYARYKSICHNHLMPFFKRLRLRDLTPAHVRAFTARKLDEGLEASTIGMMQDVFSAALNQAVYDDLLPKNPARRVKKPASREHNPMRALSHEEASRLISAAEGTRDEALIVVALRTGMRQGELLALRWEDVNLSEDGEAEITVRRSANTRTSPMRVSTTKTGEERTIGIGPRTVAALKAHRARQLKERMAATSWADPGFVFPNTRGKLRRRDSVVASLRRMLEEADLPSSVRFHDLRHTCATLAIKQKMPIHVLSKMLGHANPTMTLKRYAHVLDEMRQDAARAMDELY